MTNLNTFNFDQMVSEKEGKPVTTSLKVAEYFGKQHKHVLRDLKKLDCSNEFIESNFGLSEYIDQRGRRLPMYTMTKNGFMFLVMGFTGAKAAAIKEAYINAFDWMHEQLNNISKSYMEMLNKAMLQFKQEQSIASYAGRTLRHWQDSKPMLESKINEIASKAQLKLELANGHYH
ncbi:Rha family transcriptional regulator [Entomomonas moraniae]|uniref:Rha family transcriptional regulator n=1 Tax=Entomomonas moraniae TaxID=2213226 RepID=A0A3S9XC99_9GAMM|nr:Rha family transcriptional regulator [Entomomonas moraniae]AZS50063.1 Rha family transcriptional regulator [Entomomonas moraniae]